MKDPRPLETDELVELLRRVFSPGPEEQSLAILVDLPDQALADDDAWRARRELAAEWAAQLAEAGVDGSGVTPSFFVYRNVRRNNADLPAVAWRIPNPGGAALPTSADDLDAAHATAFSEIFAHYPMLLAITEMSATAPLKLAARQHGFRAATMPGFSPAMVPALRLDYVEVDRRVRLLKGLLDSAVRAEFTFAHAQNAAQQWTLTLDLRHRQGFASGGLVPNAGEAGNLPSGEAYIVPYEGERAGDASASQGELPVQFGGEIVVYRIEENRAVAVSGDGPKATRERERLTAEPAYGNLAELGLGVLSDFGIAPIGELLLDEKLGLHIAFGRSDHFGGRIGAKDFSEPAAVVHVDRVYLPETMPLLRVPSVDLINANGSRVALMRDGRYAIDFG